MSNNCSKIRCPFNASTFKDCSMACEYYTKQLTNGDMIKALYPTAEITDHFELGTPIGNIIYIRLDRYQEMRVQQDWWNSPYKAESEG